MRQIIIPSVSWQKSTHPFVQDCVSEALDSARHYIRDSMSRALPHYVLTFRSIKIKFRNPYTGAIAARSYFLNGDAGANTVQLFQVLPILSKVHVELSDAGGENVFAYAYIIAVISRPGLKQKNPDSQSVRVQIN